MANYNGGGTERATFLLANNLKIYHDIFILSTGKMKPTFSLDSICFDYLPKGSVYQTILALRRYIKKMRIDILIALEALGGICAIPAAKSAGCKIIIWEHANYYQKQGSKYTHLMRKIEMMVADAYVVLTKRDLNNFQTHFHFIRTKLVQIYNIANLSGSQNYDINSKIIISAGHIQKLKNFSLIPEIAHIVFQKYPDWQWRIYGSPMDDEYERLKEQITKYHMEEHVLVCGRSDNMDEVYKNAAIYVMTSLQEGFPMVLLEAKEHGLPIISFDIETGPDEIIEDGVNGFLIEPYLVPKMAERILSLIKDENKRIAFSNNATVGLDNASKQYVVSKWLNLFSELQ